MPDFIVDILNNVFYIGYEHMYSVVDSHSSNTLEYLDEVIRLMKTNNLSLPPIEKYLQLSIKEKYGWGLKVNKDYFD